MPSLNFLIETGEVCQFLREKKMFYQNATDPSPGLPEGPFWCAFTQSLLGPDGQVADAQNCRPGRPCCETA